jgi:hypothetical protein
MPGLSLVAFPNAVILFNFGQVPIDERVRRMVRWNPSAVLVGLNLFPAKRAEVLSEGWAILLDNLSPGTSLNDWIGEQSTA